jgi:polyamine oxidase
MPSVLNNVLLLLSFLSLLVTDITTATESEEAPEFDYDIIIMGAGMTGISAGHILNRERYKILIIEAQDYVGGRTHIVPFAGTTFNVGASWIEGWCDTFETNPQACAYNGVTPTEVNPMQTLAKKFNLKYTEVNYDDRTQMTVLQFLDANSTAPVNFADKAEVNDAWNKWDTTQDCMLKLWREMESEDYWFEDISYFTALYKCGWAQPLTDVEKMVQYVGFTFEFSEEGKYTSFMNSALNVYTVFGKQTQFITDPRGYPGITLGVAAEYLNIQNISAEPKLIINSPITKISYSSGDKIAVTIEPTDGTPMRTITAKWGINTFSLGVFQSDIVTYTPPLPNWKRDAFLAESMIDYLPVLVQFPTNFWDALGITTQAIEFVDPRDNFWIWAYNFDHPTFYPGSHVWRFDIIIGDAVRVSFQSENDTIWEFVNEKMSHFFGKGVMPDPVAVYSPRWPANRYVQGSYSNWNMGMNGEKWAEMIDPFPEEGLFFGGEALAIYSGDVQGSYNNGILVAREVIACDRGLEFEGEKCPNRNTRERMKGNRRPRRRPIKY